MKKTIRLTEKDLTRLIKKIINESEIPDMMELSKDEWEDVWFKLKKLNKSFSPPDNDNIFGFGGLFFHYSNGHLKLPPQKLSDWRDDIEKAAEILDNYISRLEEVFMESEYNLKLDVDSDYSMKIYLVE